MIKQSLNLCYHAHCGVKSNLFLLYTYRGNSDVIYHVQLSPQELQGTRKLAVFITGNVGTRARELGDKVNSGEQFAFSFR